MANETEKALPSSKKKRLLLALAGVSVLVLAGAGYAVYSGMLDVKKLFAPAPPPAVKMSEKAIFHPLGKFVISIPGDDVQHYMMMELALVSHDPRVPKESDELEPVIRNALMQYFSNRQYDQVRKDIQNIEPLQQALKGKILETVKRYGYQLSLDEVLLTKVVVQ